MRFMRAFVVMLVLAAIPALAPAQSTLYTGSLNVPAGGFITFASGGNGCAIVTNGQIIPANCPAGTASFAGSGPIVISGTNPYTISCPTCLLTSGGSTIGLVTFTQGLTLNGTLPMIIASTNQQLQFSSANNGAAVSFTSINAHATTLGPDTSGAQADTVGCGLYAVEYASVGPRACVDTAGNGGFVGDVWANAFHITSKRSLKKDIAPIHINALQTLADTCWSQYAYRGLDTYERHTGFIGDCAPSILSGPKHDHFDVEAVATVDALAIMQLEHDVYVLAAFVALLFFGCIILTVMFLTVRLRAFRS